jgi:glycerophosphoryl diester phosphodiesterase
MARRRIWGTIGIGVLVLAGAVYLNNASWLAPAPDGPPLVVAHRGLGQIFSREGLTGETCTAERMIPVDHAFLENTLDGIAAAYDLGAAFVEIDVQPTTDGDFVVFHDWTLDCRTDGTGETRAHDLAALRALDIGYGYTADGGATFPFRGRGRGLMPTLGEVLDAFPDGGILINVKSSDPAEGRQLAALLSSLPAAQLERIAISGDDGPLAEIAAALPDIRMLSRHRLMECATRYLALGWSGYVPESCRNGIVMIPADYAPFVWGWPNRFLARMRAHGTLAIMIGPLDESGYTTGIDSAEVLDLLPARFDGAVWTNRADVIAPLVEERAR